MDVMKNVDYMQMLRQRWPYMFGRENIGIGVMPGWQALFTALCERIDAGLSLEAKAQFHWFQVKEKFGSARFYWDGFCPDAVAELIHQAQEATAHCCLRCGDTETAALRTDQAWVQTLCDRCAHERAGSPARWRDWWEDHWERS